MKTYEIRAKLLEQKAIFRQSLIQSEQAKKKIEESIASVSDEDAKLIMEAVGFRYDKIRSFDLERMKTDELYREASQSVLDELITKLHAYLEGALNV